MKFKIKDLEINYEVYGTGKPIIMLHGYCVDHRLMTGCMEPIFENISGYKRIYLDLPGMGKSKGADFIKNADSMLEVIIEFIQEIIPNENFILIGQSYGGYLARGLIYKMGNRVDGLMLLCPVIKADAKERNVPFHVVLKMDKKLLSQIDPLEVEDFKSIQVVHSKKIWERYRDEILSGLKLGDKKFLNYFQENGYKFSFDLISVEKEFKKPTLMIFGRQDSCVGYKDALNILDKYPRATVAVLDRAGHNLHIEQEDMINSLVKEWIIRVKEF